MKHLYFASILIIVFSAPLFSQKNTWDSTYYRKYKDRLVISVFQSYRSYGVDISQKLMKDTVGKSIIRYLAESNNITGFEIDYDKFSLSVGFKTSSPESRQAKGDTKYTNLALNIGGNRWIMENSYKSYTGFYNTNTSSYDTSFNREKIYTKLPSLKSESYKVKFLYFTNANKFSFKSGYSCSQRQLKSAFSFILTANAYYNRLNADSSFIPLPIRSYYSPYQSANGLNVIAFSIYGGASFNLVLWKAFFMNLTLVIGPEEQWRTYHYLDTYPVQTLFYTSVSGDFRGSIGVNFKKFFMLVSSTTDFSYYTSGQLKYLSKYGAINLSMGYRFKVQPPKIYKKFQQTKIYKQF